MEQRYFAEQSNNNSLHVLNSLKSSIRIERGNVDLVHLYLLSENRKALIGHPNEADLASETVACPGHRVIKFI